MWTQLLTRREFLDYLLHWDKRKYSRPDLKEGVRQPGSDQISLVWFGSTVRPLELPHLLFVDDAEVEEFLASTFTYLSGWQPITSVMRILPWSMNKPILEAVRRGGFAEHPADIFVSAIIAETISELRSRDLFQSLPINSFTSTYSYTMARCLMIYSNAALTALVEKDWFDTRRLTKQAARKAPTADLIEVWKILIAAFSGSEIAGLSDTSRLIHDSLLKLNKDGLVSETLWMSYADVFSNLTDETISSEPREDRVRIAEEVFEKLRVRGRTSVKDDFLIGYLTSLISDGTFDHAELLFPLLLKFPMCIMWYGICGGVNRRGRLDGWRRGLGVRLTRELCRRLDLAERPTADISMDEFRIVLRSKKANRIIQANGRSILVELLPGVEQSINWPHKISESVPGVHEEFLDDYNSSNNKEEGSSVQLSLLADSAPSETNINGITGMEAIKDDLKTVVSTCQDMLLLLQKEITATKPLSSNQTAKKNVRSTMKTKGKKKRR